MKDIFPRNPRINFTVKEIKSTEIFCLKIIDYKLDFLNVYDYLEFFQIIGIIEKSEIISENETIEKINLQTINIIMSFLSDIKSLNFSDLQIACGSIKIIREINNLKIKWLDLYKEIFFIEEEHFTDCYEAIKK